MRLQKRGWNCKLMGAALCIKMKFRIPFRSIVKRTSHILNIIKDSMSRSSRLRYLAEDRRSATDKIDVRPFT